MNEDAVLIGLVIAIAILAGASLARRLDRPYPIVLVLGGLALGVAPGIPSVRLDPNVVFFVFLPPLVFAAAFVLSPRALAAHRIPIVLLAFGLVLVTAAVVAVAVRFALGIPWGPAFVLGAIVGPTDPVAATTILGRLGAPRRIVDILEGESLVNDATALIAYKIAIAAVVTGRFSLGGAAVSFVVSVAGSVALGLALGFAIALVRRRIDDPQIEIALSLITPYLAYLPAEEAGVSGILAAVTVGVYLGWRSPELSLPVTRLESYAFWSTLTFLLNAALFMLVGLQFPRIVRELHQPIPRLALGAAVAVAVVIAARLVWQFPLSGLIVAVNRRRGHAPTPAREWLVVGWGGMRGPVTMAAALAVPFTVSGGGAFPHRPLLVFLAYCVVLCTLVVQGLTLAPLVRGANVCAPRSEHQQEVEARYAAAEAALARAERLAADGEVPRELLDQLTERYRRRLRGLEPLRQAGDADEEGGAERRDEPWAEGALRRELIAAERETVVSLHQSGQISREAMRRIERELDLEEARFSP